MTDMEIYTIGFTQTTAEFFFGRLRNAGIQRLLDTRFYHSSPFAGFAKAKDLPYFLKELVDAEYEHEPLLAPTEELLDEYRSNRKEKGAWESYVAGFQELMAERQIETALQQDDFEVRTALLCSEVTAERCHRRLICEYLAEHWPELRAMHL
jgi:uncharacterized protein (DUF488 family)